MVRRESPTEINFGTFLIKKNKSSIVVKDRFFSHDLQSDKYLIFHCEISNSSDINDTRRGFKKIGRVSNNRAFGESNNRSGGSGWSGCMNAKEVERRKVLFVLRVRLTCKNKINNVSVTNRVLLLLNLHMP